MLYLSKSKYCSLWRCPKLLWLDKFKPEEKTEDPALQARFDEGNVVGDLAMGLFGDFVEVTAFKEDGKLDLNKMCELTQQYIDEGVENICEASFIYNGLYCAVDILRKDGDGYAIYEVKSSTEAKYIHSVDIAYQKYVLENCGVKVTGTYLVCLDNTYIRGDELEIDKLFKITDVSETVNSEILDVPSYLLKAEKIMKMKDEPDTDIGIYCHEPYDCQFWDYCTKHLPNPSVFNVQNLSFKKKVENYNNGLISFEDLLASGKITNKKQIRQMQVGTSILPTQIDKDNIRAFLDTLSYPLYFLDFEGTQDAIPPFKGVKPNAQVVFQYSLHYIEHKGGELKHKGFLGESGVDSRRALAEKLCKDIPMNSCVTVFNKNYESTRLNELATAFPDLAAHLLNINDNIVDFIVPFRSGHYLNKAMAIKGKYKIKVVLPALFPDDPELDYLNLEGVHNGNEAMNIFPKIKDMPPEEQEKARQSLLKYCELDTYAMVKIWEELERVAK